MPVAILPVAIIPVAIITAWMGISISAAPVYGQGKLSVARELVEQISKKFTKEVAEEGADRLATRVQPLLAKLGTEGSEAITRVGPRAVTLMEEARAELDGTVEAMRERSRRRVEEIKAAHAARMAQLQKS